MVTKSARQPLPPTSSTSSSEAAPPDLTENKFWNSLAQIFDDVQRTTLTARKASTLLSKHLLAMKNPTSKPSNSGVDDLELFFEALKGCLNRLLTIKKKESCVDKIFKFMALWTASLHQADSKISPETVDILTGKILSHLLAALSAKEKTVRLQAIHLLSLLIDSLSELSEDQFEHLKAALILRCGDKESAIRKEAIGALARFQDEDQQEQEGNEMEVLNTLLNALQNDTSPEVRKAALANIQPTPSTLPYLLSRIRDTDAQIRRFIFRKTLCPPSLPDFRVFSIGDREAILNWGLRDRDAGVRDAAEGMLCKSWIGQCGEEGIFGLLAALDVVNTSSGNGADGSGGVVDVVLDAYFGKCERRSLLDMKFDASYWEDLSAESVVFMRAYYTFIHKLEDAGAGEGEGVEWPELTTIAVHLQKTLNSLTSPSSEEQKISLEYTVSELLKLAALCDYGSDEVGKRNMSTLLRTHLLTLDIETDSGNLGGVFDVLQKACETGTGKTAEFVRVVCDVVQEMMDPYDDEDQDEGEEVLLDKQGASEVEKRIRLKSIIYITLLLERLSTLNLSSSSSSTGGYLSGHLGANGLMMSALKSEDVIMQVAGLQALIQYCLLNEGFARQNLGFLFSLLETGGDLGVRKVVIEALFDLCVLYGVEIFNDDEKSCQELETVGQELQTEQQSENEGKLEMFMDILVQILTDDDVEDDDGESEATAGRQQLKESIVEGSARLFCFKPTLRHKPLFSALLKVYFLSHKDTNDEDEDDDAEKRGKEKMRQCLAFFFPLFGQSSLSNGQFMACVYADLFFELASQAGLDMNRVISGQVLSWLSQPSLSEEGDGYVDAMLRLLKNTLYNLTSPSVCDALSFLNKLPHVSIPETEGTRRQDEKLKKLEKYCGKLCEELKDDKVACALMKKFADKLI